MLVVADFLQWATFESRYDGRSTWQDDDGLIKQLFQTICEQMQFRSLSCLVIFNKSVIDGRYDPLLNFNH